MLYTKSDAEKATKVLFFEGAGLVERGEVENCRIRTAFTNDAGEKVYLELWGVEVTKNSPERYKQYENVAIVDYCYIITEDGEKLLADIESRIFEYSKIGILAFVNQILQCSFDEIKITDKFDGYRVHKDGGGYNFIEDFDYDPVKADKARKAYNKIDMQVREQLCEKYSRIRLLSIADDHIKVQCYASDQAMQKHGLTERNITVYFEEESFLDKRLNIPKTT